MLHRVRGVIFALPALITLAAAPAGWAAAEEKHPPPLPKLVEGVLPWFPEDTETVVAARSFAMPRVWDGDEDERSSFPTGLKLQEFVRAGLVLEGLEELEGGKYLAPLTGRTVSLALRGGRNFESISAFGHFRSEGCAVVVFDKELGAAATRWTEMLREGAEEVRKIAGRDVFVFPATKSMNPARRPKPWLGVCLVLLKPDTILCATSDRFLEELLMRIDAPSSTRALPAEIAEWKYLDAEAPAWMLRHVSEKLARRTDRATRIGVTWALTDDQLRVVLITDPGAAGRIERAARGYRFPDKDGLRFEVERRSDGTVTISSKFDGPREPDQLFSQQFFLCLHLDQLQGIDRFGD